MLPVILNFVTNVEMKFTGQPKSVSTAGLRNRQMLTHPLQRTNKTKQAYTFIQLLKLPPHLASVSVFQRSSLGF